MADDEADNLETWLHENELTEWTLGFLCDNVNTMGDLLTLCEDMSRVQSIMESNHLTTRDLDNLLACVGRYKRAHPSWASRVASSASSSSSFSSATTTTSQTTTETISSVTTAPTMASISSSASSTTRENAFDMTTFSSSMFKNRFEIESVQRVNDAIRETRKKRDASLRRINKYEDIFETNRKNIHAYFSRLSDQIRIVKRKLMADLDESVGAAAVAEKAKLEKTQRHLQSLYRIQSDIGDALGGGESDENKRWARLTRAREELQVVRERGEHEHEQPLEEETFRLSRRKSVDNRDRLSGVRFVGSKNVVSNLVDETFLEMEFAADGEKTDDDEQDDAAAQFAVNARSSVEAARSLPSMVAMIDVDEDDEEEKHGIVAQTGMIEERETSSRNKTIRPHQPIPINMSNVRVLEASSTNRRGDMTNVLSDNDKFWLSDQDEISNQWLEFDAGCVARIEAIKLRFSAGFDCHPRHFSVQCNTSLSDRTDGLYVTAESFETSFETGGSSTSRQRRRSLHGDAIRSIPLERTASNRSLHRRSRSNPAVRELRRSLSAGNSAIFQRFELEHPIVARFVRLFFHDVHSSTKYPYCLVTQVVFE